MAKLDRLSSSDAANAFNTLARTAHEMATSLEDFDEFFEDHLFYCSDHTVSVHRSMDTKPQRLRCEYCGCLSEKDYGTCEHCGAPL